MVCAKEAAFFCCVIFNSLKTVSKNRKDGLKVIKTYEVKLNEVSKLQQFVNGCVGFSRVSLIGRRGKFIVDAKSVMGLFSLDLAEPVTIEAEADTEKELEAFDKWVTAFSVDV